MRFSTGLLISSSCVTELLVRKYVPSARFVPLKTLMETLPSTISDSIIAEHKSIEDFFQRSVASFTTMNNSDGTVSVRANREGNYYSSEMERPNEFVPRMWTRKKWQQIRGIHEPDKASQAKGDNGLGNTGQTSMGPYTLQRKVGKSIVAETSEDSVENTSLESRVIPEAPMIVDQGSFNENIVIPEVVRENMNNVSVPCTPLHAYVYEGATVDTMKKIIQRIAISQDRYLVRDPEDATVYVGIKKRSPKVVTHSNIHVPKLVASNALYSIEEYEPLRVARLLDCEVFTPLKDIVTHGQIYCGLRVTQVLLSFPERFEVLASPETEEMQRARLTAAEEEVRLVASVHTSNDETFKQRQALVNAQLLIEQALASIHKDNVPLIDTEVDNSTVNDRVRQKGCSDAVVELSAFRYICASKGNYINKYSELSDDDLVEAERRIRAMRNIRGKRSKAQTLKKFVLKEQMRRRFPNGNPTFDDDFLAYLIYDILQPNSGVEVGYISTLLNQKGFLHVPRSPTFFYRYPNLFTVVEPRYGAAFVRRRNSSVIPDNEGHQTIPRDNTILIVLNALPPKWQQDRPLIIRNNTRLLKSELASVRRHFGSLKAFFLSFPNTFTVEKLTNGEDGVYSTPEKILELKDEVGKRLGIEVAEMLPDRGKTKNYNRQGFHEESIDKDGVDVVNKQIHATESVE